ncbi:MAG: hypothetical protein ABH952_02465 [Candidatus Omnitrophota bacterium]|nr:hypothetical protein [Candidatus Omnitrophota bacterium]
MRFAIFFLLLVFPFHNGFSMFARVEGVEDARIRRVVVSPLNPKLMYIASDNSLFKSQDGGQTFEKVSVFKDETVQHLFFDPYLANILYVVASRHIFKVGNKVETVFTSSDEESILTAVKVRDKIYVGTTAGIYFASDDILNWERIRNLRNDAAVYSIAATQEAVYIASSKGVYVLTEQNSARRVFVVRSADVEDKIGIIANIIKVDIFDESKIWLGTNQGLFVSLDKGQSWVKLYIEGIDNLDINSLGQKKNEKNSIYLAASKGFLKVDLDQKISQNISAGVLSAKINWVEVSFNDRVYLATSNGVFVSEDSFLKGSAKNGLEELLKNEPAIEEIQTAALLYNEIHPDKIKRWRNGLKFRALFPSVDLDFNKTIYGTAGTNNYDGRAFVGPRDWSVGFSWDVANVIWNSYEDDVDTRSRLNTQLRLDLIDELNRVYFERLRLKREIKTSSLFGDELFQKQLRLKELDAIIDGYTGGHFSKRVKELNEIK